VAARGLTKRDGHLVECLELAYGRGSSSGNTVAHFRCGGRRDTDGRKKKLKVFFNKAEISLRS
jgi:hypothetical protein